MLTKWSTQNVWIYTSMWTKISRNPIYFPRVTSKINTRTRQPVEPLAYAAELILILYQLQLQSRFKSQLSNSQYFMWVTPGFTIRNKWERGSWHTPTITDSQLTNEIFHDDVREFGQISVPWTLQHYVWFILCTSSWIELKRTDEMYLSPKLGNTTCIIRDG